MKRCPGCEQVKDFAAFSKARSQPDGLQTYCKDCQGVKVMAKYNQLKAERPEGFPPVTEKGCSTCFEVKPGDQFYRQKYDVTGLSSQCKSCVRVRTIKKKYGLDAEAYQEFFSKQNGVCAICQRAPKPGRGLAVDHCHDNGYVRGLLCGPCNTALGKLPTVEILERAITYLKG